MYSPGYAQSGNNIFNLLEKVLKGTNLKPNMFNVPQVPSYGGGGSIINLEGSVPERIKSSQTPIIRGLDSNGQVDRTQSDEYKSIRAQYDDARKNLSEKEAAKKGLELFQEYYADSPLLTKTPEQKFNPLMQRTFGYQTGQAPDQVQMAPDGVTVMGDLGSRAQSEGGYSLGMNSGNPLVQQEQQQEMTADQANAATTAGTKSITERAEEELYRLNEFQNGKQLMLDPKTNIVGYF